MLRSEHTIHASAFRGCAERAHHYLARLASTLLEQFRPCGGAGDESQMTSSNRAPKFHRRGGDTVWQHWLLTRAPWEAAARAAVANYDGLRV